MFDNIHFCIEWHARCNDGVSKYFTFSHPPYPLVTRQSGVEFSHIEPNASRIRRTVIIGNIFMGTNGLNAITFLIQR